MKCPKCGYKPEKLEAYYGDRPYGLMPNPLNYRETVKCHAELNVIEVVGSGGITIVDPSRVEFSSVDSVREGDPVCLIGIQLHVLTHGSIYNLHTREALGPRAAQPSR